MFGQIKQARGFRQFLLRGAKKVGSEWAEAVLGGSGPGHYLVIVQKNSEVDTFTVEAYDTNIRCTNSAGVDTPTHVLLVQNK